jgi:exodeoxyribonuclease VII small subunit
MSNISKSDFGTKLKELEAITEWFESEDVDLNQALTKFERGMQLADELKGELKLVENRVEKIKQRFDAPATNPADPTENLNPDAGPTLF